MCDDLLEKKTFSLGAFDELIDFRWRRKVLEIEMEVSLSFLPKGERKVLPTLEVRLAGLLSLPKYLHVTRGYGV